jgi:hypothetical protein
LASSTSPALIVYVLDVSASMARPLGNNRRIDVVMDAFRRTLRQMVFRSTKGTRVAPRYRIAIFAYSDHVYDLLDGIKTVDQVVRFGVPELTPLGGTETAKAFAQVEKLLVREAQDLGDCPAPLVCHMTDGVFTGDDPSPIAARIRAIETADGPVLIENIFLSPGVLAEPIAEPRTWPGVGPKTELPPGYARVLREMSSPLPASYRQSLDDAGYRFDEDAVMLLPGATPELIELGLAMSAATPIAR